MEPEINAAVNSAAKAGESATEIANKLAQALIGKGEDVTGALSSARYTGQAIAAMQQQAANLATYQTWRNGERDANAALAIAASNNYDERFRFANLSAESSTLTNAKGISGGNLMAAPIVNVTVQGSVSSEQDLVTAVRNGLLATQYNGNQISLQAV